MECFLVDARLSSLGVSEIYCAECTWSLVVKKKKLITSANFLNII